MVGSKFLVAPPRPAGPVASQLSWWCPPSSSRRDGGFFNFFPTWSRYRSPGSLYGRHPGFPDPRCRRGTHVSDPGRTPECGRRAALAAALWLNGTTNAITHADDRSPQVLTHDRRKSFGLRQNDEVPAGLVATRETSYFAIHDDAVANLNGGQAGGVDWDSGMYPKYVRVQITAQAPVIFAQLLTRISDTLPNVTASAVAGVSSPMCSVCGIEPLAIVDPSRGSSSLRFRTRTVLYALSRHITNTECPSPPRFARYGRLPYVVLNHLPTWCQPRHRCPDP